jgi:2-polyprenyl-6-methoxyphenol hydroxylase-like FAD-dependent oxidoreductase
MGRHIGIIGAGVAGLHLGLHLRQNGIDATIITDRNPDEIAGMRLMNTVAHHSITLEREKRLGINHWSDPDLHYSCHHHSFETPQPIRFRGDFSKPSRAIAYTCRP